MTHQRLTFEVALKSQQRSTLHTRLQTVRDHLQLISVFKRCKAIFKQPSPLCLICFKSQKVESKWRIKSKPGADAGFEGEPASS